MTCAYCKGEGHVIDDSGQCSECTIAICTAPSGRPDGIFHGEFCRCGCSRLVCHPDAPEHAAGHGSNTSLCFPGTSAHVAAISLELCARRVASTVPALEGRVTLSLETGDEPAIRALVLSHFLNVVAPGTRHCVSFSRRAFGEDLPVATVADWVLPPPLPLPRSPAVDRSLWAPAKKEFVIFPPEFFTVKRCERLSKIVMNSMLEAWPQARELEPSPALERSLKPEQRLSLDLLTATSKVARQERELKRFVSGWQLLPRSSLSVVLRPLLFEEAPDKMAALLPWIVDEDETQQSAAAEVPGLSL